MTATDHMMQLQKVQIEALSELVKERNAKVAKINAAQGDKDAIAEGVVNSDDDQRVVDLRVKIAELQDALDVIVDEKVKEIMATGAEDVEGLKEEVSTEDKTIRSGILYFKKLYGDEAAKDLPKMDRLKGARAGGSGGKRIRGYDVVVTLNGEDTQFENFASAAKFLDTDTATLQEQFFAKAGVEKLKDAPDEVEFKLEWEEEEEDGTKSTNSAVVKAIRTGPSGVPEADSDDDSDDDSDESDLSSLEDEDEDEDGLESIG